MPPAEAKLSRKNVSFLDSTKMNDTLTVRWLASRDSSDKPTGRFGLIQRSVSLSTDHEDYGNHSYSHRFARRRYHFGSQPSTGRLLNDHRKVRTGSSR